jgi:hypothetical protein
MESWRIDSKKYGWQQSIALPLGLSLLLNLLSTLLGTVLCVLRLSGNQQVVYREHAFEAMCGADYLWRMRGVSGKVRP